MTRSPDFDEYWFDLRQDVEAVDTEWDRVERNLIVGSRGKSWAIDWIRYSSVEDAVIEGWIAVPIDHEINGAGFLWLPGYSYGTPPADGSNLVAGAVTFAINVHGNSPDAPYVNPAGKNDYILQGIQSPKTFIYRRIIAHCLKALSVLSEQPEIVKGVGVGGMSQGGGLALIVAAQSVMPKICCADMPFLTDIRRSLTVSHSPAYRVVKEYVATNPWALSTMLLFDTLNHARSVRAPTWLSAGGKDPACRPETVETLYKELAAVKKMYEFFPNAGHVFLPEMNAAYQQMIDQYIIDR